MRNGGAAAHKAVKGALGAKKEYVQPTHTIQTEEGVNSEPKQVHQAFTNVWSTKVFKLERENRIGKSSKKNMASTYQRYRTHKVQSPARTCTKWLKT